MIELLKDFNIIKSDKLKSGEERYFVQKTDLIKVLNFLKNISEYEFDMLKTIYCKQKEGIFEISYFLYSTKLGKSIVICTEINAEGEEADSVSSIYSSADWDEREIFDLFGIKFNNHPNMKRILLPEEWTGHPLRKDYKNDDERLRWNYE